MKDRREDVSDGVEVQDHVLSDEVGRGALVEAFFSCFRQPGLVVLLSLPLHGSYNSPSSRFVSCLLIFSSLLFLVFNLKSIKTTVWRICSTPPLPASPVTRPMSKLVVLFTGDRGL